MYSRLRPINDYVLIRKDKEQEEVKNGLIIPTSAHDKLPSGSIVCPGKSTELTHDQQVIYKKFSGINLDDEFIIVKEEDVLGVL